MKRNLPNIYSETFMRPPSFSNEEVKIPSPSKVPTIVERDFSDPIYDQLAEISKKKMEEKRPHLQKKMKEQELENLNRLLMDHEEEMGQDKPTFISPPDEEFSKPTSLMTSANRLSPDKILKMCIKYAAHTVMLPPPSEELGEQEIIVEPEHSEELEELSFKTTPAPVIKQPTEKEMLQWEEFVANRKIEKELAKDLEVTKEITNLGKEEKLERDMGTIPAIPGKKQSNLSPNTLLKMCSKYHDLCCKF